MCSAAADGGGDADTERVGDLLPQGVSSTAPRGAAGIAQGARLQPPSTGESPARCPAWVHGAVAKPRFLVRTQGLSGGGRAPRVQPVKMF